MKQEYLYRCVVNKRVNNGLKERCTFEQIMFEGPHHCPVCGNHLKLVSQGASVTELLQQGLSEERAGKK